MMQDFARALGAYRQAGANVPPRIAVVRLYDELIRCVRHASEAAAARRLDEAHSGVLKATSILLGLAGNLDTDQSPDLATTLKQTYLSNIMALNGGFGKPDMADRYDRLVEGLTELRNSWAQIAGVAEIPARSD